MKRMIDGMSSTKYMLGYIVPVGTLISIHFGGRLGYVVPFYAFVLIPILECILPKISRNVDPEREHSKINNIFYDWLLYLNLPAQFFLLTYYLLTIQAQNHELWEYLGMTLSMGISCGVLGINVAHELGHRKSKPERILAKLLLLSSLYMHFIIEHNRGHHRYVSTDKDPASARYGESLYHFWLRSISWGFRSAWNLEVQRLRSKGIRIYSLKNEMLRFQLFQAAFITLIGIVFGIYAMAAFICAAVIGILLLETVNYIEHYGLRRMEIEPGIYEKVKPHHSWNSDHILGRLLLYELTRHSDHHYKASRKYQILRHFDESPQLPLGYPGSMVLALFPPIWFAVMNKRVNAIRPDYAVQNLLKN